MKELFKNKLFIIISLFIILVTFISSSCFASNSISYRDYNFVFNDEIFTKFPYIFLISNTSDDRCKLVFSSSPLLFEVSSNNHIKFHGSGIDYYQGTLQQISDILLDYENRIITNDTTSNTSTWFIYDENYEFVFSSFDIYDLNNNLVFQAPPQQVEAVTIPAIQQVGEIPQGMNQVLQVIIPIGLIVLSIGLVVYLMRLVIYRMK